MPGTQSTEVIGAGIALPDHRTANSPRGGRVAVAAWDQDILTLGAQAAQRVLDAHPGRRPATLILASVTTPFAEGGNVGILGEMLGVVGRGVTGLEIGGSVAAGLGALRMAIPLASADGPVLVVAGDVGRSDGRKRFGDGAIAVLLGSGGDAGTITDAGADLTWFMDRWRTDGADSITLGDRSLRAVAPGKGFAHAVESDTHVDDANPSLDGAGHLGCAASLVSLFAAFVGKRKGTRYTVSASSGGVSHSVTLVAGSGTKNIAADIGDVLDAGVDEPLPPAPDLSDFDPYTSESRRFRERAADLRLEGRRNPATGEVRYPPLGDGDPVRLARAGTVFTHTTDYVYPVGGPQSMAVVALDGGGRFYGQVIDGCRVEIGERVSLVPRRLHLGGGVPQYFWKVAPEGRH